MEFKIPHSMKLEHEELHEELKRLASSRGKVAEAAREVAQVLHPHFEKEEEYALPPLGLLPQLARGEISPEMADVLKMTDRLKAELPHMLEEHKAVVATLERLVEAAKRARRPDATTFAEKLELHAKYEEEVSYPTSILIGEYVKLKLGK
ncbi:MAG TPA: hemerythrin domain-containing protein [Anaerolineales bacterium]|nr:hemerythrin domain-containing protein [Anaerolineales bacterium]